MHKSTNGLFDLTVFANRACKITSTKQGLQYFPKDGLDPFRPIEGYGWARKVAIKFRDKSGEILGVDFYSSGWTNPLWGGSFASFSSGKISPTPVYSDGLDLAALMGTMKIRIPTLPDLAEVDFKLKVFLSHEELYHADGTRVPPEDCKDFETAWLPGYYLKEAREAP